MVHKISAMPEVLLKFQLPDGATRQCYSPSTVIRTYFRRDETMPLAEFLARGRLALNAASARVRARYGYSCAAAQAEILQLESLSGRYPADAVVRIIDLETAVEKTWRPA
jgi:uncharacterized repeat protein (TIGR04042 family)